MNDVRIKHDMYELCARLIRDFDRQERDMEIKMYVVCTVNVLGGLCAWAGGPAVSFLFLVQARSSQWDQPGNERCSSGLPAWSTGDQGDGQHSGEDVARCPVRVLPVLCAACALLVHCAYIHTCTYCVCPHMYVLQ